MAASLRPEADVPGDRPGRLVRPATPPAALSSVASCRSSTARVIARRRWRGSTARIDTSAGAGVRSVRAAGRIRTSPAVSPPVRPPAHPASPSVWRRARAAAGAAGTTALNAVTYLDRRCEPARTRPSSRPALAASGVDLPGGRRTANRSRLARCRSRGVGWRAGRRAPQCRRPAPTAVGGPLLVSPRWPPPTSPERSASATRAPVGHRLGERRPAHLCMVDTHATLTAHRRPRRSA